MTQPKRIFIVGHSGAGKGVVAEGVAKKLGWQYINADFALGPSIGRPVVDTLGKEGEKKFEDSLSEILSAQCQKENIVVSTDDSIISNEKNRKLLSSEFVVYLKVSTPVQFERIGHNRPLLPMAGYKEFLDKFHHERDALYEEVASFSVDSDDNALEEHIDKVIKAAGK